MLSLRLGQSGLGFDDAMDPAGAYFFKILLKVPTVLQNGLCIPLSGSDFPQGNPEVEAGLAFELEDRLKLKAAMVAGCSIECSRMLSKAFFEKAPAKCAAPS